MTWPVDNLPVLDAPGQNQDSPPHDEIHEQAIELLEALRDTLGLNVNGDHSTVNQRLNREAVAKVNSGSRGSHFEGRLVWDLDLNSLLESDGASWSRIAGDPLYLLVQRVGVNTNDPQTTLHVAFPDSPAGPDGIAREVARFARNSLEQSAQISIVCANGEQSILAFGRNGDLNAGRLVYDHGSNNLSIMVEDTNVFDVVAGGSTLIGVGTGSNNFEITSNGGLRGVGLETFSSGPVNIGTGNNPVTVFNNDTVTARGVADATTGAGANMFITTNGAMQRSTSARRYKTDIGRLDGELAEELVLGIEPVIYRSNPETNETDHPEREWVGIIADQVAELGALGRRLCSWQDDARVDADDLDIPSEVEHIQYERLVAPLVATVQRQHARIEQLEARLDALEA